MSKKKTKKKKIIADYRRRMQLLEAQKSREVSADVKIDSSVKVKKSKKASTSSKKKPSEEPISLSEKEQLDQQAKLITGDLKKTVVLSLIGIGIIFGLYFFGPF